MLRPSAPRKCRLLPGLRSRQSKLGPVARAPEFRRVVLATRGDEEGQPITDVKLASDGKHLVFTTGAPRGDEAFNPASLSLDAPSATLWLIATSPGAEEAVRGWRRARAQFLADGRMLLFKRDRRLLVSRYRFAGLQAEAVRQGRRVLVAIRLDQVRRPDLRRRSPRLFLPRSLSSARRESTGSSLESTVSRVPVLRPMATPLLSCACPGASTAPRPTRPRQSHFPSTSST